MRLALGCMRVSGVDAIRAAIDAGVTTFDTARAYGESERLLARAIVESGVDRARLRVVTKVGMLPGWRPDGRARTIVEQTRQSLDSLAPVGVDVLLLHAIDPRTSIATSVRALSKMKEEGVVRAIGVSNVGRAQLDEAMAVAPISVVQVPLGAFDDASARGGLLAACAERGIELLAHSPLGGPKRAPRLGRDDVLASLARSIDARLTPIELFLAYLLHVHPSIVPLVGATRVETVAGMARAQAMALDEPTLLALDDRFPGLGAVRRPKPRAAPTDREVVMVMGIAGAGKSRLAESLVAEGHRRLNRDERGGSLRAIAQAVDEALADGERRIVVDNTYLTRASRNEIVSVAHRRGARVRCVHLDTPLREAQVNVVTRLLARTGTLEIGDEVRPTTLHRMARALERPSMDEGFDAVEIVPFARITPEGEPGAMISLEIAGNAEAADRALSTLPASAPVLVFAWRPDATDAWRAQARSLVDDLARRTGRTIDLGVCAHPAGPPTCWCRPPLPGLWIEFARRRGVALGLARVTP